MPNISGDPDHYSLLTTIGQAKIANSIALGQQVKLKTMVIGDGAGTAYDPTEDQTAVKNEVYRMAINAITITDTALNMIEIIGAVPADIGGFIVREIGILDDAGDLIIIVKTPEEPKFTVESGAAKEMIYRVNIIIGNADVVELKIDPTVIIATKADVAKVQEQVGTLEQLKTDSKDNLVQAVNELAVNQNNTRNYTTFTEIDPTYNATTPILTVFNAMQSNSVLNTTINQTNTVYPAASGSLTLIKLTDTTGSAQFLSSDGKLSTGAFSPSQTRANEFSGGGVSG